MVYRVTCDDIADVFSLVILDMTSSRPFVRFTADVFGGSDDLLTG